VEASRVDHEADVNKHSNNDLTRYLNNPSQPSRGVPDRRPAKPQARDPGAPVSLGGQRWSLGTQPGHSGPLTEREVRGLFAALSKGTRDALGREPTVAELMLLKDQVNVARALLASVDGALRGQTSVHVEAGRPVFHDSTRGTTEVSGAA
jgi:hypothetical protein